MQFIFLNNFSQELANSVGKNDTQITLDDDRGEFGDAGAHFIIPLTIFDDAGAKEIVYVTGESGANTLDVIRRQDGTSRRSWPAGSGVECRVIAGHLTGAIVAHRGRIEHGMRSSGASQPGTQSIAIGDFAGSIGNNGVAIQTNAQAEGDGSISLGVNTKSTARNALSMVRGAGSHGAGSLAVGIYSYAAGDGAIAIGPGAVAEAPHAYVSHSLPIAPRNPGAGTGLSENMLDEVGWPRPEPYAYRNTEKVVLVSDLLDLTSGASSATIDMPAHTLFFIDQIDVVVVEASGAGGSPQVSVGTSSSSPADILAATTVAKTTDGGRETHAPLIADGVSTIRAAVASAGSGTTYLAKVVAHGYAMQMWYDDSVGGGGGGD